MAYWYEGARHIAEAAWLNVNVNMLGVGVRSVFL